MANLTNELAKECNRAAAERMRMAWILTALSLTGFGFGLDKTIGAISSTRFDRRAHVGLRRRLVSMGLCCW